MPPAVNMAWIFGLLRTGKTSLRVFYNRQSRVPQPGSCQTLPAIGGSSFANIRRRQIPSELHAHMNNGDALQERTPLFWSFERGIFGTTIQRGRVEHRSGRSMKFDKYIGSSILDLFDTAL